MVQISIAELIKFEKKFYEELKPMGLRFGQAFYNEYIRCTKDEIDNLFYVSDSKAIVIIFEHYIEGNNE